MWKREGALTIMAGKPLPSKLELLVSSFPAVPVPTAPAPVSGPFAPPEPPSASPSALPSESPRAPSERPCARPGLSGRDPKEEESLPPFQKTPERKGSPFPNPAASQALFVF